MPLPLLFPCSIVAFGGICAHWTHNSENVYCYFGANNHTNNQYPSVLPICPIPPTTTTTKQQKSGRPIPEAIKSHVPTLGPKNGDTLLAAGPEIRSCCDFAGAPIIKRPHPLTTIGTSGFAAAAATAPNLSLLTDLGQLGVTTDWRGQVRCSPGYCRRSAAADSRRRRQRPLGFRSQRRSQHLAQLSQQRFVIMCVENVRWNFNGR